MVWTPFRLYLISTIYYNYKSDLKKNNLYRCFFSKKLYICNAFHLIQAREGSPINIAAGIFYVHSFGYIPIGFRPPCGALMRPLPVSGGMQRESGTFLVSFPVF